MKLIAKDWFDYLGQPDTVCLWTGNLTVTSKGLAVMGAGLAQEVQRRIDDVRAIIGGELKAACNPDVMDSPQRDKYGNLCYFAPNKIYRVNTHLWMVPVKYGWWEDANLELIRNNMKLVNIVAETSPDIFVLNFPGIGAGHLKYEDVLPILEEELKADNIIVVTKPHETHTPITTNMKLKVAVIGTRDIKNPKEVLGNIIKYLQDNKLKVHMVSSGNAVGTDQLANAFSKFEGISVGHYLPWESYNKELRVIKDNIYYINKPTLQFDKEILHMFPHMENQSQGVWALIRRNFQIILGVEGNRPVDIVFWHTTTGELTGGTRYGVLLARRNGILDVRV